MAAIPASGWEFDRWEGFYNVSENPVYIRMDSDKNLSAYFMELPTPTPTPTPSPTPTPTPTPKGPEKAGCCDDNCFMTLEDYGSSMKITLGECWEDGVFAYKGEFIYDDEPDRGYDNLRDPSYDELIGFLADDKTNEIPYSAPDFMCYHYSMTVRENANDQGLRCAAVMVSSVVLEVGVYRTSAHTIVAFNTTDKGIIYIEPQNDNICQISEQWQPFLCCVENIEELDDACNPTNFQFERYIFRIIHIW